MVETIATIMMTIKRNRGEPREQAKNDECAADDLDDADERPHHLGIGDADIREPAGPEDIREDQLLNAFREEHDKADEKADENRPARRRSGEKRCRSVSGLLTTHDLKLSSSSNSSPNSSRTLALAAESALRPAAVAR